MAAMSDSFLPQGLQSPRLFCPRSSPGKNAGVGCHSLLQRVFPTLGLNLGLLHCRQTLYHLSHQGRPIRHRLCSLYCSVYPGSSVTFCVVVGASWSPSSLLPLPILLPTGDPQCVLCICESISFFLYSFFVLNSLIPYMSGSVQCLCLSYLIHLDNTLQVYTCFFQMARFHSFSWLSNIPHISSYINLCLSLYMCLLYPYIC